MRKMTMAAGLLLISGSTVAMAQDYMGKPMADMGKTANAGMMSKDNMSQGVATKDMSWSKASYGWTDTGAKFAPAGYDTKSMGAAWAKDVSWTGDKDMMSADAMSKMGDASTKVASWDHGMADGMGKAKLASYDTGLETTASTDKMAMMENDALVDSTVTTGAADTGMGGPFEPAGAQTDYPPCSASVTDSCIQLYERGVRESYASWQAQRGSQLAQGGPYEPVPEGMSTAATYEPVTQTALNAMDQETGTGGPYEPVEEHADAGMADTDTGSENAL